MLTPLGTNTNRIIVGHINVNSIRNKFDDLKNLISRKVDILAISETKLDNSFPINQFIIDGFCNPYRFDRNKFGGGLMIYVKNDIPSKRLNSHNVLDDTECLFIEINLKKIRWLICYAYNPHKCHSECFFENISKHLEHYENVYENFIILGDFNSEESETSLDNFMINFSLKDLVKIPTCYKNPKKPKYYLSHINQTKELISEHHCLRSGSIRHPYVSCNRAKSAISKS